MAKAKEGGTMRARQAAETRARLQEAAEECFARHGFDGVAVDEIANVAGVNKQLVYHYFANKAGLHRAVLQNVYLQFRGDDEAILKAAADPDPIQALRGLAKFLFRRTPERNRFQRILQDVNLRGANALEGLSGVRESYARLIDVVANILERGAREGVFRPGLDPVQFYISLVGILGVRVTNAVTLSYVLDIDLATPEGEARSQEYALNMLIEGIRKR